MARMARGSITTVSQYLSSLPPERREVVAAVRKVLRSRISKGFQETINWGMICYEIPLEKYPDTYNRQPLMFAALAAQKNHYGLYLMCVYPGGQELEALQRAFARAGRKLDMGKSCVRFKRLEDIPLDDIGEIVGSLSPGQFIARYEAIRDRPQAAATKKPSAKAKSSAARKGPRAAAKAKK